MRGRILALGLGLALASASAAATLAATGGGSEDLGLDGVQVISGTASTATGSVTLSGSITCSQDIEVFVFAQLSQAVGRFNTIRGWGQTANPIACDAAVGSVRFALAVFPEFGKFAGGSAVVDAGAEAVVCDEFDCVSDDAHYGPAGLKLRGGRG